MSSVVNGGNCAATPPFIQNVSGGGGGPSNGYVAEDDVTFYVAEDGSTFYVQE